MAAVDPQDGQGPWPLDAPSSSPRDAGEGDDGLPADYDPLRDAMAPPREACECRCLLCGRTFSSDQMWFQRVKGARDGFPGFWMCPTPNCDGAGFTFDIFPTDPDHPANDGWRAIDWDETPADDPTGDWDAQGPGATGSSDGFDEEEDDDDEWDPDETKYKELDALEEEDDDLEGEEWKLGLEPGERPTSAPMPDADGDDPDEERGRYDLPDLRPRELDWYDQEREAIEPDEEEESQ